MNNPDLKKLKDVFKNYSDIQAVYLFGSTATGKTNPESDLDLAILSKNPSIKEQKLDILTDLARNGFCRVDLVLLDKNDIVLQYEAVRLNRVIYQTPDFNKGETYSRIVRKYLDFYPYLKVQRIAYKKRILNGQV